ncbi:MAG: HlyD family type I secretion periplasmic adaptor subunit [Magnetospirillum sp. WYHS-4]
MNRLDALVASHPLPTWRSLAWPVMILVTLMAVWSRFAQLDEVAIAIGEVVPQGKVKVVQHLEGGIILQIFVTEGARVSEGEPLLLLDLGATEANRAELQVRLDSSILERARLQAEAEGGTPKFPRDVAERRPSQLAAEINNYEARKRQLGSKLSVLREQVRQKELEVDELDAKRRAAARNLKLSQERRTMSEGLLSKGLTARMDHLSLEADTERLQGEVNSLESSIPRTKAAIAEAKERVLAEENAFRREAREELGKSEQAIGRVQELLNEATRQGVRAEIKSPIDGIVKNMRYHTLGGVVKAGEPILELVPIGENLVIEAKLNPTDRGYVREDQDAMVKVSTYDYARYGGLEGKVVMVAPDSSTDDKGNPFFRVVVQTDKTYLGKHEGELPIMPGMQATVDIRTGQKSVLEYLVKPVLKLRHEAFRER